MRDLSTCTILVVDDTETNIDILMATLGEDYDISVAMDGETALEYLEDNPADLILLDIMMPGMDGYEVMRHVKANERTRDIPVVFCTAMTETADETKGLELGAVDYIRKPFSPPMVKARVRNHLQFKLAQEDLLEQNVILRENTRLREEVERITRHDLKTPLCAVINMPKLLMSEGNITENQAELLQMVEEAGYRMLEIINSSLDLYKIETGRYYLREAPVDMLKLVRQIRGETRELIQRKEIEVQVRLNGNPPREKDNFMVTGEEMLCYSMLANLVKNAVEASPHKNMVTITLSTINGPVVSIHNQGAVPVEIRDRFFDKYTTSGKQGGTGLGTYSANLIAGTLGGKIELETSEEKGTTLKIFLRGLEEEEPGIKELQEMIDAMPGADPVHRPAAVPPSAGITRQTRVLIVDDYPNMRRTIIDILKQMGFISFLEADDGASAKAMLDRTGVGLVISDWNMPHMNGLELLQYIRSREDLKNIPFIMITGETIHDNVSEALKYHVSEYIIKPFAPDTLKEKIDKILRGA